MAEEKKTTTAKKTPAKTTAKKAVKKTEVKKETTKKVVAKKAEKQVKVTLVKSPIGYNKKQSRVLVALGLGKLNSSHILPDNACVRGMVNKVSHLVKMEEVK